MNDEALLILKDIVKNVPETAYGVERQMLIGDLVARQSQEERVIVKRMFDSFLLRMFEIAASDIDMGGYGSREMIWYRIYGDKKADATLPTFHFDEMNVLVQSILLERQRQFLYENRNLDFSYTIEHDGQMHRYRADTYFDLDQIALNMRAINQTVRSYKNLDFHTNVTRVLSLAHTKEGLILITGITGSGKSTTLDSIVDANNHVIDAHVVIIASPVEYVHKSDRCIIRHREVGRDVLSFKEGAVQALRQDPDIIVIGELRDPDTILTALEITDSGHKVFSTLHTSSAVESIDRIIGEVPPIEQERVRNRLADVLQCVISQKLVPSLDKKRVLAKEVMIATPSVRAAIKNNNTGEIYQMMSESGDIGMVTMEQDLKRLYLAKKISLETVINFANNKRRLQQLLNLVPKGD
ncbi:MAG: Flp pilus assembly complex ATPase component TadA [Ignavibacteriae bacterium]|nr:Flp pilus assembly complex ATPase component TadA [Ignavibacteria bacterium]MBI3364845.1 Flp pilus assembly complex ATPase component TadA [Ignavibacteriota bacterium]